MRAGTLPASQYAARFTTCHAVPFQRSKLITRICAPPVAMVGALYVQMPAHWYGPERTICSLAFSAACEPALIAASVHCGPPDGFGAGPGWGTLVQFGLPFAAASTRRGPVCGPTTPSTGSLAADWNHRMAVVVRGPSLPSIVPALHPSALSSRWINCTLAASLVPVFVFGFVLPLTHVRA